MTESIDWLPTDNGPIVDRAAVDGLRVETFAQTYVSNNFNAAKAAAAVGYASATSLLARPEVMARIQAIAAQRLEALQLTDVAAKVQLARIATSDIRGVISPGGGLLSPDEWDDATAAAVSSIEVTQRTVGRGDAAEPITVTKVKLWDKNAALNVWARHFKIVGDVDEGVSQLASALADRLREARKREVVDVVDVVEKPKENPDEERIW